MTARLITDETAARIIDTTKFVDENRARIMYDKPTPSPPEEVRSRVAVRGIVMKSESRLGGDVWVQLKAKTPLMDNWFLRYKLDNRANGLEEFDIIVTTSNGSSFTKTIELGWSANKLMSELGFGEKVWVRCGQFAELPDFNAANCDSWHINCLKESITNIEIAEEDKEIAEVFPDIDSTKDMPIVKASRIVDTQTLHPGTVVLLVDLPDRGYTVIAAYDTLKESASTPTSGCGTCEDPVEFLTEDLGGGLMTAPYYLWSPLCNESLIIVFGPRTGGVYPGTTAPIIVCNGSPVDVTDPKLTVTGPLAGQVVAEVTLDEITYKAWNLNFWNPGIPWGLYLQEGDPACLCNPFKPLSCLEPIETPPE